MCSQQRKPIDQLWVWIPAFAGMTEGAYGPVWGFIVTPAPE
jgi:hypothetical protein